MMGRNAKLKRERRIAAEALDRHLAGIWLDPGDGRPPIQYDPTTANHGRRRLVRQKYLEAEKYSGVVLKAEA